MVHQVLLIITLLSIWLSLTMAMVTLFGAVHFWLKNSTEEVAITPLRRYPTISIVVPAHNEDVVIAQTMSALLNLNYPADKVELLLYSDNSDDHTADEMRRVQQLPEYRDRNIVIVERTGKGGKAGVLNESLEIATGEYIAVYYADAMPERNALYFLVRKALEDPERHVAVFGRNKTRNAEQNLLTRFINQEIVVTQRVQHIAIWHLFKIGRIPGTNFIIRKDYVTEIGGWRYGALTEDTDISFKIMQSGKLIALAYNSEAFQQEPEHIKDYYYQRLRWAEGNYQVVINNIKHLFDRSNWRVKIETFYYAATFFWFNAAILLSDILFVVNVAFYIAGLFNPAITIPFTFGTNNVLLAQVLLVNWVLMILLYMLQINIAMATQFGQATTKQIWLSFLSYFTYTQLFMAVSVHAVLQVMGDALFHRNGNVWVKTKRFND